MRYTTVLSQQTKFIPEARVPDTSLLNSYNLYNRSQHTDQIAFAHQAIRADLDRLRNIQYVGKAMLNTTNPQLYARLNNLTNLSPYRSFPYAFGQLLIPQPTSDTTTTDDYKKTTRQNTAFLGQKGIYYSCDEQKVDTIEALPAKDFVTTIAKRDALRSALQTPCADYHLPHYLAFVYFHYIDDPAQSSNYYRIAAFDPNAPTITASMPSIIMGRLGQHIASAYTRYSQRQSILSATGNQASFGFTNPDTLLAKAVFEVQLNIIEQAAILDTTKECLQDYPCLVQNGFVGLALSHSSADCATNAADPKADHTICNLLQLGIQHQRITTDGSLVYPLDPGMDFARYTPYNTRWISPRH